MKGRKIKEASLAKGVKEAERNSGSGRGKYLKEGVGGQGRWGAVTSLNALSLAAPHLTAEERPSSGVFKARGAALRGLKDAEGRTEVTPLTPPPPPPPPPCPCRSHHHHHHQYLFLTPISLTAIIRAAAVKTTINTFFHSPTIILAAVIKKQQHYACSTIVSTTTTNSPSHHHNHHHH